MVARGNKESKFAINFVKLYYITIIYGNNSGIKLHSQATISLSLPFDCYWAYLEIKSKI